MWYKPQRGTKTSSRRIDDIEALSERLGSLQIMNEVSEEYKQSDTEMSPAPAPASTMNNKQATMSKNMVLDPGWFDGDRTKFKDWWREI